MHIVRIDQIEYATWFIEYVEKKKIIDIRLDHNKTEQLLFD
jgi:hypothetical protein